MTKPIALSDLITYATTEPLGHVTEAIEIMQQIVAERKANATIYIINDCLGIDLLDEAVVTIPVDDI